MSRYFNYQAYIAQNWWDRRVFLSTWWRFYRNDPRRVPPYYADLQRMLAPPYHPHLARLSPLPVHLEAMYKSRQGPQIDPFSPTREAPIAAVVALWDPRRQDRAAYLGLLRCHNEPQSLKRFVDTLAELLRSRGCQKIIGPTGLSPHLQAGLPQDYWHQWPPLHTPYAPPYMPEVVESVFRPLGRSQLYRLAVPPQPSPVPPAPARLVSLEPARLAADLLPLLVTACSVGTKRTGIPAPDEAEADFLLRWLGRWPLPGWLALVEQEPVGFILLQPDLAPRLGRADGGRSPFWRLWLAWAAHRPTRHGRVLYMAVLPEWQGRGIGRQLLGQALRVGHRLGWQSLTFGPLPTAVPAIKFLKHHGAEPGPSYLLYRREL